MLGKFVKKKSKKNNYLWKNSLKQKGEYYETDNTKIKTINKRRIRNF